MEMTAPTSIVPPDEAQILLKRSLDVLRMTDIAAVLFSRVPRLRDVALRLAWFMPPHIVYPFTQKSLLSHFLEEAVPAASREEGMAAARAFINLVLANVSRLLELEIAANGRRWDPRSDAPLQEWIEINGEPTVSLLQGDGFELQSPRRFAAAIAYRVLEPDDMHLLEASDNDAQYDVFGEVAA